MALTEGHIYMLWWLGSALSMAEFSTDKESSVLLKAEDVPHVQHDPLTVDSIATSNESSAEPDSLLPSRSIFQPQHMICGARCPTESCRCSEL
ncbi:hypothetical protein Q8A67_023764 [Cirrhinus molitorella]|uniref:Uncharacterized protein n=1 Tax=Cirrhinus molitorella TaxID=172907 RepID=A0AA88TCV6_9TELE|nr:hypothetical protein Q8A67_023764 [Cirrhinus molitorella]